MAPCQLTGVKKKMTTRFGPIQIANSQVFSHHPNGFGISPYLQEKLVFLGQFEVYQQAAALAETLLGLSVGASQIDRLTRFYGGAIADDLDQAATPEAAGAAEAAPVGVVYAQADGAMGCNPNCRIASPARSAEWATVGA